jgi:hypothetical protein
MTDEEFARVLEEALDDAEEGLQNGRYRQALKDLLALSMQQIKASIAKASYADYSRLITVVEQASAKNVAQAQLVEGIKALGTKAVAIAKLIPSLRSFLP